MTAQDHQETLTTAARWSGVTSHEAELLLDELSESPLPGARYARDVVKRRLPAIEAEAAARQDWERLAEAWANVMDGRRIGDGLNAARIGRATTTTDDWHSIAREYDRLSAGDTAETPRTGGSDE